VEHSCSILYALFQEGLNGMPSWREIKGRGIPLHKDDRTLYSKYLPIIETVQLDMASNSMTEAQAKLALDTMQRQLAARRSGGSSGQRQHVGVSDMAYGFAWVRNLDTQIKAHSGKGKGYRRQAAAPSRLQGKAHASTRHQHHDQA
jgi:hypothetical protein